MMTRSGEVIAIADDSLVVRFERASACGNCRSSHVCAGSNATELVVPASDAQAHRVGETVQVNLDSGTTYRAIAVAYLLPLAGLLLGMAIASQLALAESEIALSSFGGLGAGFLLSRRLSRLPGLRPQPALLEQIPTAATEPDDKESPR